MIGSRLSLLLAARHAKSMYTKFQTTLLKECVYLIFRDEATCLIVLLDRVILLHVRESQAWLVRR